ncbi:MAG: pseudouridine synthase [Candidatus Sericytochromatia bacterium]|nr:pseudouridine synthase [Candidatus Sericytochromatia bacterium]
MTPTATVLALWKPFGVMSQFSPSADKPTLKDYVDRPEVYPVGRLDHDSEGLLLLTDDGTLSHRLTDPHFDHPKTYWVQVEGVPTDTALYQLRTGVDIQGQMTKPAGIRRLPDAPDLPPREIRYRAHIPTSWIELILTEGRNRQVRRMTAAVGFPTLRLVRVAVGPIGLTSLQPGEWRQLTAEEVQRLHGMDRPRGRQFRR